MFVRKSILRPALAFAAMAGRAMAQAPAAEEDIRGPKPLIEIPGPEKLPIALWAGAAGAVALIAIALIVWKKHLRKQQLKSPPEIALASLAELEASREALAAEAFANQAARTLRQYIADRFGLAAPRRTTEEFFRELERHDGNSAVSGNEHLKGFLKSCDLAKFAGSQLDSAQRGELLRTAREFIAATAVSIPNSAKR